MFLCTAVMATKSIIIITLLFLLLPLALCSHKKVYVVSFGEHRGGKALHEIEEFHHSYLRSVKETEEAARDSLLYSYKHSINGFAALLTPEEASKLSEMEEVVTVSDSKPRTYSLHTTRSWEFLGLKEPSSPLNAAESMARSDLLEKAKYGEDVIVGLIDNGVWPESGSFSDEGMGPVPQRWKGICQNGAAFNSTQCNKKIIGARYYIYGYQSAFSLIDPNNDYISARDKDGHGTHTASIVAGREVPAASALGGFAGGTATGGAPKARLAIYKACWAPKGPPKNQGNICLDADVLAAIDDAIHDGVDVLSISLGFDEPLAYEDDVIAKGTFHAIKKNIVVVGSAGNRGPKPETVSNLAPWIITVGASTVDRTFMAPIVLGNGQRIEAQSIVPIGMENNLHPLVYAGDVEHDYVFPGDKGYCLPSSLLPDKVKGKIVLCMRGEGDTLAMGVEVQRAGAAAFVIGNSEKEGIDVPCDAHLIPASAVAYENSLKLLKYIRSDPNPMAHILPGRTLVNTKPAPFMASFSSRGPNTIDHSILKPDIIAPGVNILGAWTETDGPTRMSNDQRVSKYNIFSGTSMACPHVAAAAVLLKAIHPTWSSAAIRSALMTTADTTNNMGKPITDQTRAPATPFDYGSGHLNPTKAADPGLVYDATYDDYLQYTCSLGVTLDLNVTHVCPKSALDQSYNLNYPSVQIHALKGSKTVTRTVTNVGDSKSSYTFDATPPKGFSITANPSVLTFDQVGQKKRFTITVSTIRGQVPTKYAPDEYYFGWYTWTHENHVVKSPVAVSLG